jgi:Thiol:disulfide interchange protein
VKRTILFAFLAVFASQQMTGATWYKSIATAQAEAKKKNALIFVDLFADWCGWCHRMEQEVFPSEKFQQERRDMVLLRLNTEDRAEGTKFAREFEVRSLPTFLVLSPDLTVAGAILGYAPPTEFTRKLADTRADYNSFLKRAKDEPAYAKDYKRRLDLAKEFVGRRSFGEAEKRLTRLVGDGGAPRDIRDLASYNLALTMVSQKKYAASVSVLTKLLSRVSKGESAEMGRILLGQIYFEQGDYSSALRELKRFKTSFPDSAMMANVNSIIPQVEKAASKKQ